MNATYLWKSHFGKDDLRRDGVKLDTKELPLSECCKYRRSISTREIDQEFKMWLYT